jgi:hypothetical protein
MEGGGGAGVAGRGQGGLDRGQQGLGGRVGGLVEAVSDGQAAQVEGLGQAQPGLLQALQEEAAVEVEAGLVQPVQDRREGGGLAHNGAIIIMMRKSRSQKLPCLTSSQTEIPFSFVSSSTRLQTRFLIGEQLFQVEPPEI